MKRHPESGNALWFILLAVALLAALTATISRSTDTAEQSGNVERYRIHASAIMRHTASIRENVNTMRLNGFGENEISFDVSFLSPSLYANPNCTAQDCVVYGSAGGGASYLVPSSDWLDADYEGDPGYGEWEFTGANIVNGIGSANADLLMYIGYLQPALCSQINNMLGISNNPFPTDGDNFDTTRFQGVYAAAPQVIDNMDGHESGCFRDEDGREYTFYQTLIKR